MPSTYKEEVLSLLKAFNRPVTMKDLKIFVSCGTRTLRLALRTLIAERMVKRIPDLNDTRMYLYILVNPQ